MFCALQSTQESVEYERSFRGRHQTSFFTTQKNTLESFLLRGSEVAPVIFLCRFKAGFDAKWKASCGKHVVNLEIASRDAQTLNLSRNVSKFYAWQVGSWRSEQQSKYVLLTVDPLSTIRNNKLNTQGEKLEADKLSVERIYCRRLHLKRRCTIYGFFSRISAP